MGGTEIGDDKTQVVIEGYIFQVDRSVPKIIDYVGPANEVIVTSKVTQNGDWKNPIATVTGTIIKYGGGTVTSSSAVATNGVPIPSDFPSKGGSFTIPNIATDTVITIITTDSEGKTKTHTINVKLIKDETPPEITTAEAKATQMKIKIQATAEDKESGISSLRYSITPTTGLPTGQNEGDLTSGTPIEITSTSIATYTITFTATNGAGITATKEITGVKTSDAISVEEAKNTVTSMGKLQEYVGTKVDYKPGETWQIFYYDDEGDFGPEGTLYLKRAYGEIANTTLTLSDKTAESDPAVQMMRRMNPKWRDSSYSAVDKDNEKICVWLYDSTVWNKYKNDTYSSYAIGSPSVEMYMKAFNVYKTGNKNANNLICKIGNANGYKVGAGGEDASGYFTNNNTIEAGPGNVFMTKNHSWCLASPSAYNRGSDFFYVNGTKACVNGSGYNFEIGVCPVVPLDL